MAMYLIARTATKRPSLMHKITEDNYDKTICGLDVSHWSRTYTGTPILVILCMKCKASGVL